MMMSKLEEAYFVRYLGEVLAHASLIPLTRTFTHSRTLSLTPTLSLTLTHSPAHSRAHDRPSGRFFLIAGRASIDAATNGSGDGRDRN